MQVAIKPEESARFVWRLKFPPAVEREFQESYYFRVLTTLRNSTLLFFILSLIAIPISAKRDGILSFVRSDTLLFVSAYALQTLFLAKLLQRKYFAFWQPLFIVSTLIFLEASLLFHDDHLIAHATIGLIIIGCRWQRLQLRWMALQILGVVPVLWSYRMFRIVPHPSVSPFDDAGLTALIIFVMLLIFLIPLIWTYRVEKFERSEFLVKYLLAQERNEERLKREHSEQMLHILSQAIGSIVHDLGNPLTAVQGGAQTLLEFAKEGQPDREMVQEFAAMITDGAQMLNYLRLSLMEQTRVLEDKPVPVKPAPTSLRDMVKSGIHYQKPKFATGRDVSFEGDDLKVCVDEMRFITIFMNLIGNALKYSDGAVRITWRTHGEQVLIAVQDQGQKGMGISQSQAEKLFVAFGRLDTHTQIEGTGLGLLSVRNIAQAHGGEVYIEGYCHGSADSAPFCTAEGSYPAMREPSFSTAFVATCPLDSVPQPKPKKVLLESVV